MLRFSVRWQDTHVPKLSMSTDHNQHSPITKQQIKSLLTQARVNVNASAESRLQKPGRNITLSDTL